VLAAPLLRYDLLLVRRSFADAFATGRDRLLLVLVGALLLLWLRGAAMHAVPLLPPKAAMLAVLAGPAAFGWTRAAMRRLAWFRETSILAPDALAARTPFAYLACAQVPLLAVLTPGVLFLGDRTGVPARPAVVALLSYGFGIALAAATNAASKAHDPPRTPSCAAEGEASTFRIMLARQVFGCRRPVRVAALLVAAAALATVGLSALAAPQPAAVRFAAALLPSTALLIATARNAPEIIGLLAFAGYKPRAVAAFVCALPAANLAGASAALLLVRPEGSPGMLAALLVLHLFAALVATARAWLSPGRSARQVDSRVQLELLGALFIAAIFAPLALLVVPWRLWLLHKHYSNRLWIQA
jgi:hypothetical protein